MNCIYYSFIIDDDPEDYVTARPHLHKLIKIADVSTNQSDGSEVTNINLGPKFPNGMFVAMSDNKTFQIYNWDDIIGMNISGKKNTWGNNYGKLRQVFYGDW